MVTTTTVRINSPLLAYICSFGTAVNAGLMALEASATYFLCLTKSSNCLFSGKYSVSDYLSYFFHEPRPGQPLIINTLPLQAERQSLKILWVESSLASPKKKRRMDGWFRGRKNCTSVKKGGGGGGKKALDILLYISYYLLTMSRENVLGNTKQR